jgi:SAM-dependent methyltransferase
MALSDYYNESVERGAKFQRENKSWDGKDTLRYHRPIKDVIEKHKCKTLLDYGCGKGTQWNTPARFAFSDGTGNGPEKMFIDYLGLKSVYRYDPCIPAVSGLPPAGTKFDIVICTQVLPYIPDDDIAWVKQLLQQYTGKACFIGMHNIPPKDKKQIHEAEYFTADRTEQWYRDQFSDWTGPPLYWWFRGEPYNPDWMNK